MLESEIVKDSKVVTGSASMADLAADSWNDMRLLVQKPSTAAAGAAERIAYDDDDRDRDRETDGMTPYEWRQYRQMPKNEQYDFRGLNDRERDEYLRKDDDDKYKYLRKSPNERMDEDYNR